jgi:peptidoglycan/LPS O-acetylase OafA/YrhL
VLALQTAGVARDRLGTTRPPSHRRNNFDFLRLIGALLVIYGHSYPLTGHAAPGFADNGVATIGVKIFFVISGYLVALSWLRDPDPFRFMLRRCLRIFPALSVVVILSIVVLGPLMTTLPLSAYFRNPQTLFYLTNIALYINYGLPGVFDRNIYPSAINGSLWSLPAEFLMYLLTPLLFARSINFWRFNVAVIAILSALASVMLIRVLPRSSPYVVYATNVWSWVEVAAYFAIGAAIAFYRLERLANPYVAFGLLLLLAVANIGTAVKEMMLLVILPYAALSFGLGDTPMFRRLTKGNDLSYGIFLFGFPIQQTLTALLGPQIGPWLNAAIASAVCAGLAYLSWNFVEQPMLSWKPRRRKSDPRRVVEKLSAEAAR